MILAHVNDSVLNAVVRVGQPMFQIKRRIRVGRDAGIPENLLALIAERTASKQPADVFLLR